MFVCLARWSGDDGGKEPGFDVFSRQALKKEVINGRQLELGVQKPQEVIKID